MLTCSATTASHLNLAWVFVLIALVIAFVATHRCTWSVVLRLGLIILCLELRFQLIHLVWLASIHIRVELCVERVVLLRVEVSTATSTCTNICGLWVGAAAEHRHLVAWLLERG